MEEHERSEGGPSRRTLLRAMATAPVAVGLAGCSVDAGGDGITIDFGESSGDGDGDGAEAGVGEGTEDGDSRPTSPPPLDEDCLEHGSDRMDDLYVEQSGNQWIVKSGSSNLMSFDEEADAEGAIHVAQAYGFTDHCFLERPFPSMKYWLVDGETPATDDADVSDEDCIPFDRTNLEVVENGDVWQVVDDGHALLAFDEHFNAKQAISIIQHYEFDRACYVGRPDPGMRYFLSDSQ